MIPYDDLVAALSAWRARQGLPVSTMGGSGSGGTVSPGSGPYGSPGSGPQAKPGSGPNRPPPNRPDSNVEEIGDDGLLEEQYESEGGDFAMAFGGQPGDDSTAIGSAPERPTDNDMSGRGGKDDW